MSEHDVPSTVVVSQRALRTDLSRCYSYEIEDLIVELLGATLVEPRFRGRADMAHRYERASRASRRLTGGRAALPGGVAMTIDEFGPVDFAYVHAQFPMDLAVLEAMPGWRRSVGAAVCFIEEAWVADVDVLSAYGHYLEQFDAIFMGVADSATAWSHRVDVPVQFLPYSVDALSFAPRAPEHARGIDVINIGRRSPVTHQSLVEWSMSSDRFYYFDSFRPAAVKDPVEHRHLLGALMRNSRIAIANRGIGADPERTRNQHALPARFFEAASAGAVLLGQRPNVAEFDAEFDWTDAFFDMQLDEPDASSIVEALLADDDRLRDASRRNIAACLERHDHLHRLEKMAEAVDVIVSSATAERHEALSERARLFEA